MMTAAADVRAFPRIASGRALLVLALLVGAIVGSLGITREESFFLQGDPPRYLLDGVFLYDLLLSGVWRPADVLTFAEHYYARYPALSLGHHPPFLPASLVPFYALFGISVFAGRLAMLTFLAIAVILLYRLTATIYDERVAGWASLLLASSPIIGQFGQRVLSEMPTIALMLAALISIERFRRSGHGRDYLLFIASAIAGLLCRPTAIYMFPAYAALVLMDGGYKRLAKGRVAMMTLAGAGLFAAAIIGFLALSPFNSAVVFYVFGRGLDLSAVRAISRTVMREGPLFAVMMAGAIIAILMRDRRVVTPLVWIGSVLICATFLTGSIEPGRYTILAVPAFCILGASLFAWTRTQVQQALCALLLIVVVMLQLGETWGRPTWDTPGYEAAAQYIVGQAVTPTVLYSASVDPGYFVFFVRKHDPEQRMVVLRSDKVLTTSHMAELSVENRINSPEEIFPILQRYGTRFVAIEDRASGSPVLDWLRDLVRTDRFVERRRFPIGNGNAYLDGVSLVVYEYLDATAPAPDAELDFNIPLVGRRIRVPLSDLSTSPQTR